jgi:hypothetical protein
VKSRQRWEGNINLDFQEVGSGRGMEWIELAQDRDRWLALVNAVMSFRFLQIACNFFTSSEPFSFLRRTVLHELSK